MDVKLRDYQINGIKDIINAWQECRSVLFQMPTGTGKTTLFCEIARKFSLELHPDKKVLIITHRKELVEQAFDRLESGFDLYTGKIAANFLADLSAPIQVASIQTLVKRDEHKKDIYSLVIIDEAHHTLASTYKQLWDFYPSSKFLGVTATPTRTNGEGFQDLFDKLITTASIKWFIKNNHLSDIKYFASHTPDISNVKLRAGDYDKTELSEVMQNNAVMADLIQSYIDFAHGKKMIVFAVNRAHCNKIVEKFNSSGFAAKAIDTHTPVDERRKIVEDFRDSKFKILCNVNIFTEGFDCPDVDAVQLARPTKSLTLFLQQVGRCMRPHHSKQYGIVLDNAGLWKEHGLPKMDRNWNLNGAEKSICPTQKQIVGIKEASTKENNEPIESKGIRLVEIGELDSEILENTVNFNNIEKSLTDKKIIIMRERIEILEKKIQKFEQLKANETDAEDIKIFDENIKRFKEELFDKQVELQPQRFDQVIGLIIEKCQEIIDNNEIFVDGDKDAFLNRFVEPYLSGIKETASIKTINQKNTHDNEILVELNSNMPRKKADHTKLKATFPNGRIINENEAIDTFISIVKEFGIEKVIDLNIKSGASLIISDIDFNDSLAKKYKHMPDTTYYLRRDSNTLTKKENIELIAKILKIEISVEVIPK